MQIKGVKLRKHNLLDPAVANCCKGKLLEAESSWGKQRKAGPSSAVPLQLIAGHLYLEVHLI